MTAALVAGSAFCLLAGMFWYGLGFSLRRKNRKRTMQEEKPTPLTTKIEQMLTEARVILPGAQALLGFQLTVTLTRAFGQLSELAEAVPRRIAVLCRRGHHPADDARRASSHFVCGGGYTILPHDRVLVRHPSARAAGDRHCRGSLCRNLNGGHLVDAGRHSCACRALSSGLPLVCPADGAEGAGRWAIASRSRTASPRLEISNAAPAGREGEPDSEGERPATLARAGMAAPAATYLSAVSALLRAREGRS